MSVVKCSCGVVHKLEWKSNYTSIRFVIKYIFNVLKGYAGALTTVISSYKENFAGFIRDNFEID